MAARGSDVLAGAAHLDGGCLPGWVGFPEDSVESAVSVSAFAAAEVSVSPLHPWTCEHAQLVQAVNPPSSHDHANATQEASPCLSDLPRAEQTRGYQPELTGKGGQESGHRHTTGPACSLPRAPVLYPDQAWLPPPIVAVTTLMSQWQGTSG